MDVCVKEARWLDCFGRDARGEECVCPTITNIEYALGRWPSCRRCVPPQELNPLASLQPPTYRAIISRDDMTPTNERFHTGKYAYTPNDNWIRSFLTVLDAHRGSGLKPV